jgi:S-(hydroxymethyl)glutathione dehydrogenase/alcohol dehydrogenase
MKALVLNAIGQGFELEDVEIAVPVRREVVVEVRASGLCHTDLTIATHPIYPTAVRALLPGGADHVFDFVGTKAVSESGLEMLAIGGGLYLVGLARPDVDVAVNVMAAIGGQRRVQGVNYGSANMKRDIPMYAEMYLQGRMNLDDLVSKTISLREVNDGYAALKDGSLTRVVVTSF